ncbi:UNKNOWN [Stylonychia lemnae]|uniref:Uncharacterized protein n=1 Tax=Stylonychia lemnae TaxID=5949 RepID=A0A078B9L1_STYLE|nr:UNKNOWN [Stylonychia lemnae]|eukprot:CDW89937.1 UNKNOWN [Stylonychia lemnae]
MNKSAHKIRNYDPRTLPYGVIEKSNDPRILRDISFQEKNLKEDDTRRYIFSLYVKKDIEKIINQSNSLFKRSQSCIINFTPGHGQPRMYIPRESEIERFRRQTLIYHRNRLLEVFQNILEESNKVKASQIKFNEIISDVKNGQIPDFGLPDQINFTEDKPGWHLFSAILSPYPKYQKLASYIDEQKQQQQIYQNRQIPKMHSSMLNQSAKKATNNLSDYNDMNNTPETQYPIYSRQIKIRSIMKNTMTITNQNTSHLNKQQEDPSLKQLLLSMKSFKQKQLSKTQPNSNQSSKSDIIIQQPNDEQSKFDSNTRQFVSPFKKKDKRVVINKTKVKFMIEEKEDLLSPSQIKMLEAFKDYVDQNFEDRDSQLVKIEISKFKDILMQNRISPNKIRQYLKTNVQAKNSSNTFASDLNLSTQQSGSSPIPNFDMNKIDDRKRGLNNQQAKLSGTDVSEIKSNDSVSVTDENTQSFQKNDVHYLTIDHSQQKKRPSCYLDFIKNYPISSNINQTNVKLVLGGLLVRLKNLAGKISNDYGQMSVDQEFMSQKYQLFLKLEVIKRIIIQLEQKNFSMDNTMYNTLKRFKMEKVGDQIRQIAQSYPKSEIKAESIERSKSPKNRLIMLNNDLDVVQISPKIEFTSRSQTPQINIKKFRIQPNKIQNIIDTDRKNKYSKINNLMTRVDLNDRVIQEIQRRTETPLRIRKVAQTQQNTPQGTRYPTPLVQPSIELNIHLRHKPQLQNNSIIDKIIPFQEKRKAMNMSILDTQPTESDKMRFLSVKNGSQRFDDFQSMNSDLPNLRNQRRLTSNSLHRNALNLMVNQSSRKLKSNKEISQNEDFLRKVNVQINKEFSIYNYQESYRKENIKIFISPKRNSVQQKCKSIFTSSDYI